MATKKQRLDSIKTVIEDYNGLLVTPIEVYTDVFKLGDGIIEYEGEESGLFKTNPIGFGYDYKRDEYGKIVCHKNKDGSVSSSYERGKGKHIVMYEDTFAKRLKELQKYDFAILNGLSYFGGRNYLAMANKMHALILDLDGITDKTIYNFLYGCGAGLYPLPNYIILSGSNCHLYYVFEEPIPLYPDVKLMLKDLKHNLVNWVWNRNTSTVPVQEQGINQGFRVIGGKTKPRSAIRRTLAYRLNTHPYDVATLNDFIPDTKRIDDSRLFRIGKMSWAEASKLYPDWAERKRRASGKFPGRCFTCNVGLYKWWLNKLVKGEAVFGSRYFAMMALAIFAIKSGVSYEDLEQDAYDLIPYMTSINPSEPFTEYDVKCALECYDDDYATFTREAIERMTHIVIPKNKRNGRTRVEHLKRARAMQALDYPDGEWRGRKDKKKLVVDYAQAHPDDNVTDIAKALGISRTTVYKYLERR